MQTGDDQSAADGERDARALGTLIRALEKLGELNRAVAREGDASKPVSECVKADGNQAADAERWRHDLAARLEALCEGQGVEGGAGGAR
ncbi:MAG: hypothetical protein AAFR04_05625 [Pseudomonadota bacterium]